ncbi:YceI family protein [Aquimarina sp. 2201CG5-10]|uniref:YceI family protein n=1 Tax=Aquimarina callyspongiae TaxID=3098150 RepID=UPI002AB389F1|nr:YceI family protein [Aquimarina sp. 2201CG5-10]MDY8135951.1 YceI family protein [Aquimarina sp. 2201CG5-10]
MKKTILTILLIAGVSITNYAQDIAKLDTQKSVLYWMGSNFLGFGNHHGTVKFKEGNLILTNSKITGGSFIIDMNTIANVDGGYNKGLVDHLKNGDFFDVFFYPTAKLDITNVVYKDKTHIKVKANLTIKTTTKPIEFDAELDYDKKEMATSFSINRTLWNIVYASKFVTDMKDKMISENIGFKVQLSFE